MLCILYGTESGNAELVAEDLSEALSDHAEQLDVGDMSNFDVGQFTAEAVYLIICSTHGEGELPSSAQPLYDCLQTRPDLSGVRYAVFGMGDSSYPNYSRGAEIIDRALSECGATRFGSFGRHDASSRDDPSIVVIAWAQQILGQAPTRSY